MQQANRVKSHLYHVKSFLQRFALILLVILAFGLMLLGKADNVIVSVGQKVLTVVMVPVLEVLSVPVNAVKSYAGDVQELAALKEYNQKLIAQNQEMLEYKKQAKLLKSENEKLAKLLNYKKPPKAKSVSARVVADPGGAFAQSILVLAGREDGVSKGDVVMAKDGLAGRIAYAGEKASQVLLISDVNSRIPVFIEPHGYRAVLIGDNTPKPQITALPEKAEVAVGDKVVTSGDAGVFPAEIEIGVIESKKDGIIKVKPLVNRDRLDIVNIIDFGLKGILENIKCE